MSLKSLLIALVALGFSAVAHADDTVGERCTSQAPGAPLSCCVDEVEDSLENRWNYDEDVSSSDTIGFLTREIGGVTYSEVSDEVDDAAYRAGPGGGCGGSGSGN